MAYKDTVEKMYAIAKEQFAELGVDTESAMKRLANVSVSLHCWQGDDVAGFETPDASLAGGGIQVTGNHPGKARSADELRMDFEKALSLVPGNHRINLHAIYGEFKGRRVDRNEVKASHFEGWMDWANKNNLKLDFNPTLFSHPKAEAGFTLSSKNPGIRNFWIEHVKRCRRITNHIGARQNSPSIHNLWIPDGFKDSPFDCWGHRAILKESLDEVYSESYAPETVKDALESKLFGIGSEAYVVGSHEFYMGYTLTRKKLICLDMGHFHPTESVADKITAILQFSDELLMHISRGVRWDSDHVPVIDDSLRAVAGQITRYDLEKRVHLATDFFDGSINRVGAWTIGGRSLLKCLLAAMLEPSANLAKAEAEGDYFARLALMEQTKSMPWGAVWDFYCMRHDVPLDLTIIAEISGYENEVLRNRK